jgi:DHA1 family tetracycline resistance protein-like MFS transporter
LVTSTVDSREQGRVQGALTSLLSLTNILAPVLFTFGLFQYFTHPDTTIQYDGKPFAGAPFVFGSLLLVVALGIMYHVLKRFPGQAKCPMASIADSEPS